MNSSGWGGKRAGTGPKPRILEGGKPDSDVSAVPPEDLPDVSKPFWHKWAGLAIEKRTLTRQTVPAFEAICTRAAYMEYCNLTLREEGLTYVKIIADGIGNEHKEYKKHPLCSEFTGAYRDVMAGLARFGLAPFGKAEAPLPKKAAVNPFASVAQK